ncbi:MAG: CFI-box-CTERM domain-containing protein [Thiobacillus sp.]
MSYPTLEQYNEAFQHPQLSLVDPDLKKGAIATTGLGLPLALCGGFALTYTVTSGGAKYAVRCFHKQSSALEKRYSAISAKLKSLRSSYFLDFEFQPLGVRVGGKAFPVVKMAWASGNTLGEFLEGCYRSKSDLQQLNSSLRSLAIYLEGAHLAHGDVQPGNVMVSNGGRSVQLIDYDGIYVDDLKSLGSAELGHRNFQHPRRTSSTWDSQLDRFSFIALNLSLRALEAHPDLWSKTQSDGDAILFKANDFADPAQSAIFNDLFRHPQLAEDAKNFAAVCKAPFDRIPTLEDFLARKNIPQVAITVATTPVAPAQYMSAFPVLDATGYALCLRHMGDRVELIGRIVEVKENQARNGKPYVFINFGPWQGEIVKVSIWSEGLAVLKQRPNQGWVGKWISVVGLMEPPYRSRKYKYSHLAISITQANQLHVITDSEAKFRLSGSSTRSVESTPHNSNKEILDGIRGTSRTPSRAPAPSRAPTSQNQAVLNAMKGTQPALSSPQPCGRPLSRTSSKGYRTPPTSKSNCFIATAVYGSDAFETNLLRAYRDRVLMPSMLGRLFVSCYYALSPRIVPLIERSERLASIVRAVLDRLIFWLER